MQDRRLGERWWLWLIPLAIVLSTFYLYPLLNVIQLSFTNARVGQNGFLYTLGNYISILSSSDFWRVLRVTAIFVAGSVVFQLGLGLASALLINQELFGSSLVKLAMVSAWVVPGIITGIVWQIMYSSSTWGIINYFLSALGFNQIPFLYSAGWALFSVTLANIWRGTGFSGIMQYAALRAIPEELYEAASIDGASTIQKFFFITLPQLKPMLLINIVLITIYTFNTYDSIYSLTRGGPGDATTVLSLQAYREVFTYLNFGRGAVYAVIMLVLAAMLTVLYSNIMRVEE